MILAFSIVGVVLALIPAATFLSNLPLFQLSQEGDLLDEEAPVSVLIPARDEAAGISAAIEAALASEGVSVEVVVLDDDSSDGTDAIVQRLAEADARVRYQLGAPLPEGWNGKQHACRQLADAAQFDRLVFIDADVRLRSNALARLIARQDSIGVNLLSAFPHQETGTWLEKWIIPLMHFVLLGFLPFSRMRESCHPAYAAGCGQLFMTRKEDYRKAGTHEAIRQSRHDGLKLPRVYRQAGLMTDVIDGTELAECRMYRSAREVIRGVLKNATEGIASPKLIVPFSLLLLGGSVLPLVTLGLALKQGLLVSVVISAVGVVIGHLPRLIAAIKFRQPASGVVFHSVATLMFVTLQWVALLMQVAGQQVRWRGRV